jgi:hypothetical protein
MMGSKPKD